MKRIIRKNIRDAFVMVFLAVISLVMGFYLQRQENFVNEYIDVNYNTINTEKVYTASIIMGGDTLIHAAVWKSAKTSSGYDFRPQLKYIKEIVKNYDLKYYNQETILGGTSLGLSGYPRFNSPQQVGDGFIDAGFNLVSLANNHTLDKGSTGIKNSINYWNKKEGIVTAGSYTSQEERDKVRIYTINDITYAFLSYTTSTNGLTTSKKYEVNKYSDSQAKKDIEAYRDKVDVIMVAIHWGSEGSNTPNSSQKNIAKYLSNLGVDLIIGCHPHVVQPIGYVNDTLVIYSLGNFISNQYFDVNNLTGLLASTTIKKTVYHGKTTISFEDIKGELIYTYINNKHTVYPYNKLTNSILSNYKTKYDKYSKIVTSYLKDKMTMVGV